MVCGGILMRLTLAVAGQHGRLLVRCRRPPMRPSGIEMPRGGRLVCVFCPFQRALGAPARTLHRLARRRNTSGDLVAPLPQLVCAGARRFGPGCRGGVNGPGGLVVIVAMIGAGTADYRSTILRFSAPQRGVRA
jgi:hypothetical protein